MMPVKRSSTEYDASQAVKALFERSKILTAVVVVSTGPIGMTPPLLPMHPWLIISLLHGRQHAQPNGIYSMAAHCIHVEIVGRHST